MPNWKPEIRRRLANLKLEPTREATIIEELAQHLDESYAELLACGMSETEAQRQLLTDMNENDLLARELRRVERQVAPDPIILGTNRRTNMIADLWQDLRFGARMLMKRHSFTLIAVLTLGLGIGANTAIFSLVDGVLLRPLRYPQADQLVRIWSADQKAGLRFLETSYQDFEQFKQQTSAFAAMAAMSEANFILRDDRHEPINITVARVSEGFFPVFSTAPQLGRDFLAEEYGQSAHTVMLSHRLWQQRYASSPAIVGQTVTINGEPHTVVVPLSLRGQSNPQLVNFFERASEQVRGLPTVESVSLAVATPMDVRGLFPRPVQIEGQPMPPGQEPPRVGLRPISAEYFQTVSIPLLSGRTFNEQDRAGAQVVAIVNQTFVKMYFPHSEALGRRLRTELLEGQSIQIIGVVADVLPEAGAAARPALYLPYSQFPVPGMSLLARTAGNPLGLVRTIRERIRALDPNIPLDKIYPLEQKVAEATISPRFTLVLIGLFAALGLTLAALGIYGVMSYAVAERAREIGIRMALGAQGLSIVRLILTQGMMLTLLGLSLGLSAALGLTRWLKNLLFSVTATDPLTFAAMAMLLLLVAGLACWIPARRATKVDPLVALRSE